MRSTGLSISTSFTIMRNSAKACHQACIPVNSQSKVISASFASVIVKSAVRLLTPPPGRLTSYVNSALCAAPSRSIWNMSVKPSETTWSVARISVLSQFAISNPSVNPIV